MGSLHEDVRLGLCVPLPQQERALLWRVGMFRYDKGGGPVQPILVPNRLPVAYLVRMERLLVQLRNWAASAIARHSTDGPVWWKDMQRSKYAIQHLQCEHLPGGLFVVPMGPMVSVHSDLRREHAVEEPVDYKPSDAWGKRLFGSPGGRSTLQRPTLSHRLRPISVE